MLQKLKTVITASSLHLVEELNFTKLSQLACGVYGLAQEGRESSSYNWHSELLPPVKATWQFTSQRIGKVHKRFAALVSFLVINCTEIH